MTTIVDSPLPSEEGPSDGPPDDRPHAAPSPANPPPPRSGVPLELAELCRWQVHEIEVAVSILLADRAETDCEEICELRTGVVYLDRLMACIAEPIVPPTPHAHAPREIIARLIGNEDLKGSGKLALFQIAIWRWDGQVEELLRLKRQLEGRLTRLESHERKAGVS